jgi:hypothetical protein
MILALELRASGASYEHIGKSLDPPVSAPRAWKIVQKGLQAGRERMAETAQNLIQLQLNRLNRYRLKLEPKADDPAVVSTLVRVMERECKLMGIDAPTKIAETMPDGSPIQPQEEKADFSKFSHDELLIFGALHAKAAGDPDWDKNILDYGSEMYERSHPRRLITAFVKALPFGDEPWRTLPVGGWAVAMLPLFTDKLAGRPRKKVDARRILALRAQGLSWRMIAKRLHVGAGTAFRAAQGRSKSVS